MRPHAILSALLLLASPCAAGDIVRSSAAWSVDGSFATKRDGHLELSGVACVGGTGRCLVANDETRAAQLFAIDGTTLVPGMVVPLLPKRIDGVEMDEIDAEAAAYADGTIYVTGSHGRSRRGKLRDSVFFVFAIPVDPATGAPPFTADDGEVPDEVRRTAALRRMLLAALPDHAEAELAAPGVTVEGLAVLGPDLLFGLRSPSVACRVPVLRVARDALFGEAAEAEAGRVQWLALGENVGIRDLAAVPEGVLVLAGRSDDPRDEDAAAAGVPVPAPSLFLWSGRDGEAPVPLGALPGLDAGDKAEGLLVLATTDTAHEVLVLFDGEPNGAPAAFTVPRQPPAAATAAPCPAGSSAAPAAPR